MMIVRNIVRVDCFIDTYIPISSASAMLSGSFLPLVSGNNMEVNAHTTLTDAKINDGIASQVLV